MTQAIFQSFEQKTTPAQGAPHLKALREELKKRVLMVSSFPARTSTKMNMCPPHPNV